MIELAEGTRMAADPGLKKRLRQYQKALAAAAPKDEPATEKKAPKK